ncbi:uncharacterized protein [Aristolochia californica]|uniref:uncharacterized protein n=1 Tax=Aristolochia californica TaxID=171875 RepID=UPI0035D7E107
MFSTHFTLLSRYKFGSRLSICLAEKRCCVSFVPDPMKGKPWKIFPRPLLETILNNHAQHHRVPQPLLFHGPRGAGKTALIVHRLLDEWNKPPHVTGYVDFGKPQSPWSSPFVSDQLPSLSSLSADLEHCLEAMVHHALRIGAISNQQIFSTLNKWHGLDGALNHILRMNQINLPVKKSNRSAPTSALWARAVFAYSGKANVKEIDSALGLEQQGKVATLEEASYLREAFLSLRLAKEVITIHQKWRANAVAHLNHTGKFSRSLANSATNWSYLLLELLSAAAEIDFFQPKLVLNNIDVLRRAITTDDSSVSAAMYHDSLLWRLIALGINEMSLPVILITSDSYYSYRAFIDFGYTDIFISRETFGWTPEEAKMHMVSEFFDTDEWNVISDVLGTNTRHLSELYTLKESSYYHMIMEDGRGNSFEDIVDAYLAFLQVTVVNPAMEMALAIVQNFAFDAHSGKIPKDRLRFGSPWRHPPSDNSAECAKWAKLQLMDFIHSFINTEFGVNYFADCSLELLDDPSVNAMVEVGLLYMQRDPSFLRPISRGIQRCLVRWIVQERMKMSFLESLLYGWHRVFRGRSYRHLMKEVGYK